MVKAVVGAEAVLLAFASVASADLCDITDHPDDCSALCDLHSTMTKEGAQGLGWCDGSSLCGWDQVLCVEGRVSELHLGWNRTSGDLNAWSLCGKLAQVKVLDFNGNGFIGELPECLQELQLQRLDLGFNQLTGGVPEWIGKITSLQSLDLSGNQFAGSLPESLGSLTSLQSLSFFANRLSGAIPESVGNLAFLQSVDFEENHFSEVPASIGKLISLQFFNVASNELTELPSALGNLSALVELNAAKNHLSGSVPEWIGNLQTLQQLWLSDNQFTSWDSDSSICALTSASLIGCALRDNPLQCPIPDCAGISGPCWTDCTDTVAV